MNEGAVDQALGSHGPDFSQGLVEPVGELRRLARGQTAFQSQGVNCLCLFGQQEFKHCLAVARLGAVDHLAVHGRDRCPFALVEVDEHSRTQQPHRHHHDQSEDHARAAERLEDGGPLLRAAGSDWLGLRHQATSLVDGDQSGSGRAPP